MQFKNEKFIESEIAHVVNKSVIASNGEYNLSGEDIKASVNMIQNLKL